MNYKSRKVSVVIPVYNGEKYLPDCLESLKYQTAEAAPVIVVDNKSSDNSLKLLSEFRIQNPELRIISNKNNAGFAKACNQGIEEAIRSEADFIFLLNQDTICEPDCLEELVKVAHEDEKIFAVQALLLRWPEKDRIQTSGNKIHFLGFGYCGDYNNSKFKISRSRTNSLRGRQNSKFKDITYASGAGMLINVSALKKNGFFDEDLFLYHEDLDLGLRARFLGYKILLAPQAIVYHKYTAGIPPHRWYWSERGRQIVLLKFYKIPTLILIFPAWLLMEIGILLYSLLTGWFWLKIKSYFSVLRQLPRTLRKRRLIQKTRYVSDRRLIGLFETRFNFTGFEHSLLKYIVNPFFDLWGRFIKYLIWW